ncbi:glycosyl hydrolase [Flavobacterium cupreum]|uniref:Beta-glucosidase n=2 Tax=Flavobacterium TaxID=237 RepID=A0A4Y7UD97_9FLAO|nr:MULTISPECIES: glycoside hydrolase family 3 C-terminal domain-containing protein [Flavobacterium]RUT67980.1 glycosyl hydrolase [Flavobacterium cupreum]TCN59006.1 beta-glucosidase [Flavobacterium circumlabens]TEB44407.1 glycosyl hydrolase [Flavobacterium circumlabens]
MYTIFNTNTNSNCKYRFILLALFCIFQTAGQSIYQNPKNTIEERVNDLLSKMTLEEKLSQMVNNSPAVERLNIPAYNWWNETLHGVARSPYNVTSYPQAIAMAASWNPASLKTMAEYCAVEGRAIYNDSKKKGKTGIYLGLTYWSPNINIFRDPRWGRGQETYGEDPYLTGNLGSAFVKGLQGNDPVYLNASACAKHFAVHSGPEWSRSTYNAEVSKHDLWDTYLPAFRDLIVDAKVSGVMCAYNQFEGKPCCGNDILMQDILRKQWNFTGYVTSDCGGIGMFWKTHKTHTDKETAASDAVLNGTDCECSSDPTYKALKSAIDKGLLTQESIDNSVRRLLTIRFRLGMFDPDEIVPLGKIDISALESPAHKAHALKMAQESLVLLKNENNLLPLSKKIKKIALVGPNADEKSVMLANYYGYPSHVSTILEGIQSKVGDRLIFEQGLTLVDNKVFKSSYNPKEFCSGKQDGFDASYFQNTKFQGDPQVKRLDKKVDFKWGDGHTIDNKIIIREMSVRWSTDYTPLKSQQVTFSLMGDDHAMLYIDDNKVIDTDLKNSYYTLKAEKGKKYKIVIEYVQFNDNAEVKFDIGIIETLSPEELASRVKDADVIVFAGGISAQLEGESMPVSVDGFKGGDRTHINLPVLQTKTMQALKATGKPIVFINMSGSAMGFQWEAANLPVILQGWYAGQAGGQAIADVLFGDYNPAGRLPVTFYKNVNDLPDFENYSMENRTYRYYKGEPLYSFGYGLSYTHFVYSDLKTPVSVRKGENLAISVQVKNDGEMDGDEVVELYVSHKDAGLKVPIRSLKGFERIHLKRGESKIINFNLNPGDLSIINDEGNTLQPLGSVEISIGGSQPSVAAIKSGAAMSKLVAVTQ